jgi:hypothetical protein
MTRVELLATRRRARGLMRRSTGLGRTGPGWGWPVLGEGRGWDEGQPSGTNWFGPLKRSLRGCGGGVVG